MLRTVEGELIAAAAQAGLGAAVNGETSKMVRVALPTPYK